MRGRRYATARRLAALDAALSERDRAIVRQVAELRLMTARQIQALHFPASQHGSEAAAMRARQRVLKRLVGDGLLVALERRIGGLRAGSAGLVVCLGVVGQRLLALDGPRRRLHEPGLRFVQHTLAIGQLLVEATLAARAGQLELLAWQSEPVSWRSFNEFGGRRVLRPDAYLSLGVGDYEAAWFAEVDRSTESLPVALAKCRLYAAYYRSGQEQAASGGVFPRVCWVAPDADGLPRQSRRIQACQPGCSR